VTGAPLFSFRAARIESPDGAVLSPSLTFETDASRVVLAGAWEPLLSLLTGRARVSQGDASVSGLRPDRAAFENQLALALRDPPFPDKPTPLDHLVQSARMLGMSKREAVREADRALESLGLAPFRKRKLRTLREIERRALSVAHATLGSPAALLIDRPFEGLDDGSAERLAAAIERVAEGRRLVVLLSAPPSDGPEYGLIERAEYVAIATDGAVVAEGRPFDVLGPSRRYVVAVLQGATALTAALESRGVKVAHLAGSDPGGDRARLVVELPEGGETGVIASAALEAAAPLIELAPVGLAARRARQASEGR
jgi:ABC-type multidrug transport system ATPase subunit